MTFTVADDSREPYDVLIHTPADIDALLEQRLTFADHYENEREAAAYREGVMQSLMVLELYHGLSIPDETTPDAETEMETEIESHTDS